MTSTILLLGQAAHRSEVVESLARAGYATRVIGLSEAAETDLKGAACVAAPGALDDVEQLCAALASLATRLPVVVRAPSEQRALFDALLDGGRTFFLDEGADPRWLGACVDESLRAWSEL